MSASQGPAGAPRSGRARGVGYVLLAAFFFGVSTPIIRPALAHTDPAAGAGYLYLGQAIFLTVLLLFARSSARGREARLAREDLPALAVSVLAGGILAPGAFMAGLALVPAHRVSLLLVLEIVFTLLIALVVRRERLAGRAWIGIAILLLAGVLVALPSIGTGSAISPEGPGSADAGTRGVIGALFIVVACLGWAIDSNATAGISGKDATAISLVKGWAGAIGYLGGGFLAGRALSVSARDLGILLAAGAIGYGVSLRFFVLALRHLGAALTTSLFATAPILGFAASVALLGERPAAGGWLALLLTAGGLGVILWSRHEHEHVHSEETHEHPHVHDDHHAHEHAAGIPALDGHSHVHRHRRLVHSHRHDADIHHTHRH